MQSGSSERDGNEDHFTDDTTGHGQMDPMQSSFSRSAIRFEQEGSSTATVPASMASHGIATIPEGSALVVGVCSTGPGLPKSPSPLNSSAPTTGTTTTPTSLDPGPSPHGGDRLEFASSPSSKIGSAPEFPDAFEASNASANVPSPWAHSPSDAQQSLYGGERRGSPRSYGAPHEGSPDPRLTSSPYAPTHYAAALKLLVSNNVAGFIIGRSGQTISELQAQSQTRIKLSQSGDFFPGTQDRVCLVQGDPENVKQAMGLLLERLYMLQEQQHSQHLAWQLHKQKSDSVQGFDFVVKVLVPTTSCGMIIGKSGSNIKYMEETTGVSSVRLSPKAAGEPVAGFPGSPAAVIFSAASERIVTITGHSVDSCANCVNLVVDSMVAHPEMCRYTNMTTSYSKVVPDSYVAAPGIPVSPSMSQQVALSMQSRHDSPDHAWENRLQVPSTYGPNALPRRIASSPDLGLEESIAEAQSQERFGYQTPGGFGLNSGLIPTAVGLHPGATGSPGGQPYVFPPHHLQQGRQDHPGRLDASSPPPSMDQSTHSGPSYVPPANISKGSLVHHSMSAPDLAAFHMEHSLHISSMPPGSLPLHLHPHLHHPPSSPSQLAPVPGPHVEFSEAFAPQPPTMTGPGCFTAQVLVPDPMVGSILGRGGRALTDLQMHSGTRIKISQRGEYMPGTRSRIVTIRGPTAQTVWQAQYIMSQRMVLPQTALPGVVPGGLGAPSPLLYPSPRSMYHPAMQPVAPQSSSSPSSSSAPSHYSPSSTTKSPSADITRGTSEGSSRSSPSRANTSQSPSGTPPGAST